MKKFIYNYFLLLLALFIFFYWNGSPIAQLFNEYQTKWTLYFLAIGIEDGRLNGIDIMINPHYKVIVTKACNGLIPILVFWAAVIAYPTVFRYKTKWILIGYGILSSVNIIRLLMVSYFVKLRQDFPLYHDIIGNILLMLTGLVLFYLFLKGTRAYRLMR